MEARLKAHSTLFSSMAKLVPPLVAQEEEDEVESEKKFSVENVRSLSLGALQERLREKVGTTNRKRKAGETADEDNPPTKKKKRKEKKSKKKNSKEKGKAIAQKEKLVSKQPRSEVIPPKPTFVDENGRVVFSKFDFSSTAHKEVQQSEKNKNNKDYKSVLAKAEAAQKKLEELKKTDEKRGDELAKKLMWQRAMDMARGTKLKDDPKRLKNTIKSKEKKKKRSAKEWEERKKLEKEAIEKRQAKRKTNIEERKEAIHAKKLKKRLKKNKSRTPGF